MSAQDKNDVEKGGNKNGNEIYAVMQESPQLRWAFICKVYSIFAIQMFLTIAVASFAIFFPAIKFFITKSTETRIGNALFVLIIISPFIALLLLYFCRRKHLLNYFLLMVFTVALAFAVGSSCAFSKGRIILQALILTAVVVVSLTLYTFWAAKKGSDFQFLGPFLFGSCFVVLAFFLILVFLPLGNIPSMIIGGVMGIIFCAYIVHDTDNLIKQCSYDDYIWASVRLHLDVVTIFISFVTCSKACS